MIYWEDNICFSKTVGVLTHLTLGASRTRSSYATQEGKRVLCSRDEQKLKLWTSWVNDITGWVIRWALNWILKALKWVMKQTLICSFWTFLLHLALLCRSVDASANRSGNSAINARRPFTLQGLSKRRSLPAGNSESAFHPPPPSSSSPLTSLPTLSYLWMAIFLFVPSLWTAFLSLLFSQNVVWICTTNLWKCFLFLNKVII